MSNITTFRLRYCSAQQTMREAPSATIAVSAPTLSATTAPTTPYHSNKHNTHIVTMAANILRQIHEESSSVIGTACTGEATTSTANDPSSSSPQLPVELEEAVHSLFSERSSCFISNSSTTTTTTSGGGGEQQQQGQKIKADNEEGDQPRKKDETTEGVDEGSLKNNSTTLAVKGKLLLFSRPSTVFPWIPLLTTATTKGEEQTAGGTNSTSSGNNNNRSTSPTYKYKILFPPETDAAPRGTSPRSGRMSNEAVTANAAVTVTANAAVTVTVDQSPVAPDYLAAILTPDIIRCTQQETLAAAAAERSQQKKRAYYEFMDQSQEPCIFRVNGDGTVDFCTRGKITKKATEGSDGLQVLQRGITFIEHFLDENKGRVQGWSWYHQSEEQEREVMAELRQFAADWGLQFRPVRRSRLQQEAEEE